MKINVEYFVSDHTYKTKYKGVFISFSAEEIYGSLNSSLNDNNNPERFVKYYYNQIHDDRFPLFCEIEEYKI